MIEPFHGQSGTTYLVSAAIPNGQLFDFSTNTFKDSPVSQFMFLEPFLDNAYYTNIYKLNTDSILGTSNENVFVFIHESGAMISLPIYSTHYSDIGLAINNNPFTPTVRTDDGDNPTPRSNRRASYFFGSQVFNS